MLGPRRRRINRHGGRALFLLLALLAPASHARSGPGPEALRKELESRQKNVHFRVHLFGVVAVVTDAPDPIAAACIKHLHQVLPKLRAAARFPPDSPVPERVLVALFQKKEDGERFLKARKARSLGSFVYLHDARPERRVIAAFVLPSRPLLARLRHAAMNALLHAWIEHPPRWLSEGLGEVMEDAQLDANGQLALGPPRGHLRDWRERVLQGGAGRYIPLKELLRLGAKDWERKPRAAYTEAWGFVRFLLEDPLMKEARLLQKIMAALAPNGTQAENTRKAQAVFLDDEWTALEGAWQRFLAKLPETPGEKPYREARRLLGQHQFRQALPLLDQAIRSDPYYARLYYFRAWTAFQIGQHGRLLPDLDQALSLFPEYHAARFLRGRVRTKLGDAPGAARDFRVCLRTPYHERAKQELRKLPRNP